MLHILLSKNVFLSHSSAIESAGNASDRDAKLRKGRAAMVHIMAKLMSDMDKGEGPISVLSFVFFWKLPQENTLRIFAPHNVKKLFDQSLDRSRHILCTFSRSILNYPDIFGFQYRIVWDAWVAVPVIQCYSISYIAWTIFHCCLFRQPIRPPLVRPSMHHSNLTRTNKRRSFVIVNLTFLNLFSENKFFFKKIWNLYFSSETESVA